MTNIYKKSQSIPRTARNNRIYPGEYTGGNAPVSNGTGINLDWVSVTPEKVTINRDTHIEGNLTASEEVVAWVAGAVTSDVLAGLTTTEPLRKTSSSNIVLDYNPSQFQIAGGSLEIKPGAVAPSVHTHIISDVTGLQTALDSKMVVHTHPYRPDSWVPSWSDVTGKPATFSPSTHGHAITDVTGLQAALDGKESLITKAAGFAKWTGSSWNFVNETYSLSSHNHSGTYEPLISAGTTAQYRRGDKTWKPLNTAAVPESGNLYYTQARFDTAFSGKTTSSLAEGTNLYFTNARVKTYADTLYRPIGYVPTWAEITSKPIWESKLGWDAANSRVTISTDLHVTGNISATKDVIAYLAGEVSSDVLAVLTATAPLRKSSASNLVLDYNTSQFEVSGGILQIKAGVLAPSAHSHLISDISGLQSALDSKMVVHSHPYRADSWVPSWSDVTGKPATFEPAAHSHSYLPLAGGTMSNTNLVTNLNAQYVNGILGYDFNAYTKALKATGFDLRFFSGDGNHSLLIPYAGGLSYDGYTVYHAGNFNPSDYLPLTGGVITGTIGIGGVATRRLSVIEASGGAYMSFNPTEHNRFTIGSDSNGFVVYDDTAGQYRFAITKSGMVCIGYTSDPVGGLKMAINGAAYFNGNITAQIATLTGCNAQSFIIKDSGNNTRWTVSYNTSTYAIEFKNASGVLECSIDQSGNLKAKGEVTAYATI